MELRPLMHLLGLGLFALGLILPALLGYFSEPVFKSRLFGPVGDAAVTLAGGAVPAFIVYKITHYEGADYSQPLDTIERVNAAYQLRDGAIFAVLALVAALIVLFAARKIAGRKPVGP